MTSSGLAQAAHQRHRRRGTDLVMSGSLADGVPHSTARTRCRRSSWDNGMVMASLLAHALDHHRVRVPDSGQIQAAQTSGVSIAGSGLSGFQRWRICTERTSV